MQRRGDLSISSQGLSFLLGHSQGKNVDENVERILFPLYKAKIC